MSTVDSSTDSSLRGAPLRDEAPPDPAVPQSPPRFDVSAVLRPLLALVLLFLFLVGVQALSTGIKGLGSGVIDSFMRAVENPFIGLVTGILATTLVQSSSVTTSLIVGMVAGGALPFQSAIPMVMGANIGTTVTNTVAALAQAGRRTEYRRAFAAATCHDFFNYMAVLFLLPLEMATGYLAASAEWLNGLLPSTASSLTYESPFKAALKGSVHGIEAGVGVITAHETAASIILIVVAVGLIFAALTMIVKVMRTLVLSRVEVVIRKVLGRGFFGKLSAITVGALVTVAVQSSSITTSIMVPLAGAGLVRLWQVFPVTVGANIGTTVTALVASLAATGPLAEAARQIALVHLLFNLSGMALFYMPPQTRKVPMWAAQRLAKVAERNKKLALFYVAAMFYGVPAFFVFIFG